MAIGITRTFRLYRTVLCAAISLSAILAVGYFQGPRLVAAGPQAPQAQSTQATAVQTASSIGATVAQAPGALVSNIALFVITKT